MKPISLLKAAAFAAALTPAALLAYGFYRLFYAQDLNALTADPSDYTTDQTGTRTQWASPVGPLTLVADPDGGEVKNPHLGLFFDSFDGDHYARRRTLN